MAIQKLSSMVLANRMASLEQPLFVNRIIELEGNVTKKNSLPASIPMPVFRFPALLYGSALSTGSNASDQKASDQLDDAQTVTADPRLLLQMWG